MIDAPLRRPMRQRPPVNAYRSLILRDGAWVALRRMVAGDRARLLETFGGLAHEAPYRQAVAAIAMDPDPDLRRDRETWLAVDPAPGEAPLGLVGFARLTADPRVAEVALAVVDSRRHRGLGVALMSFAARRASDRGIECFRGWVLDSNLVTRRMLEPLGAVIRARGDRVRCLELPLAVR